MRITEHAVMRYLERVKGMDFDEIREEMRAKIVAAEAVNTQGFVIDGFTYVVQDQGVITVLAAEHRPKTTKRARRGQISPERLARLQSEMNP